MEGPSSSYALLAMLSLQHLGMDNSMLEHQRQSEMLYALAGTSRTAPVRGSSSRRAQFGPIALWPALDSAGFTVDPITLTKPLGGVMPLFHNFSVW